MENERMDQIKTALEEKDVILVITPSDELENVKGNIIRYTNDEFDTKKVYVTIAKPYNTITNILEDKGIDTNQIFFIDCITKTTADSVSEAENCVFMNPQALTDISIALTQAVEGIGKDKERFLFLDTLSTLMIYNNDKVVGKFAHSVVNKIRDWGIKSVMLTLEKETDDDVISQVEQFCDETIRLELD